MKLSSQRGFTLLEIMIVIVIIGVASATIRLAITSKDPLEDVHKSVSAFEFWFAKKQQEALFEGLEVGLAFTKNGISVLQWRDGIEADYENEVVWDVLDEIEYATSVSDLIVELILDNESQRWIELEDALPEDVNEILPHVILFPSEEYEPSFTLSFYRDAYLDEQMLVIGDGYNSPEISREAR